MQKNKNPNPKRTAAQLNENKNIKTVITNNGIMNTKPSLAKGIFMVEGR